MPIYEYRCLNCGAVRDEWHKHDEIVAVICCDLLMERQISAPNFILPVYRAEELVKKKDGGDAERDYKRKLATSL